MKKQKQNWFQELALRLTQTTPWFFRIVIRAGLACTGAGTGMLLLTTVPHIPLPVWVIPVASNLLVAGAVAAGLGKAATTTPQDLPNNQPNPIAKDTPIDKKS